MPPYIGHATIIDGDYRTVAVYKCNAGYVFSGGEIQTSICMRDNRWSLQELCLGKTINAHKN